MPDEYINLHRKTVVLAPRAKINLGLGVLGKDTGGWHALDSIIAPVSLTDTLTVAFTESEAWSMELAGPFAEGVPAGEGNLVHRAYRMLHDRYPAWHGGCHCALEKHIPFGAGLGGGSSDAAAFLVSMDQLLQEAGFVASNEASLLQCAAQLGSDVVPATRHQWSRIRGRGTEVEDVEGAELLLVMAFLGESSTPETYHAVEQQDYTPAVPGLLDEVMAALAGHRKGSSIMPLLVNALTPAVFRSNASIRRQHDQLMQSTPGVQWVMSGSGGAFYSIVDTPQEQEQLVARARNVCRSVFPCITLRGFIPCIPGLEGV